MWKLWSQLRGGMIRTAIFLPIFVSALLLSAGGEETSLLSLDRIFSRNEFDSRSPGSVVWLENGSGFTVLEPSESTAGGKDVVHYDGETGVRSVMVPAQRLVPPGGKNPLRVGSFEWSQDSMKLMLFVPIDPPGGPRLDSGARRGVQGDYWLLDLSLWHLRRLGGGLEPGTLMAAALSPDGRNAAYVSRHNLYVEDLHTSEVIPLTEDGCETRVNGASARIYMGMNASGLRWSPDGRQIAFLQFDNGGVKDFHLINNTEYLYPKIISFSHVKPGDRLPSCRAGVVGAAGGEVTWLKIPGDLRDHYICGFDWASRPGELAVQQLTRRQNTLRVMIADAETGECRTIYEEKDEAWLEVHPLRWVDGGRAFLRMSEKGGWRQVYRITRDGKASVCLTPEPFDVMSIEGVDEKNGWLYIIASPADPLRRYLYRVRIDGSRKPERVTPEEMTGVHEYDISPSSLWAVHAHSTINEPPVFGLIRLAGHECVRILEENAALRAKLDRLERRPTEFFRVDIGGGVELDGWRILPVGFDPDKCYPVLFYVYSMPAGQSVLDQWAGNRHVWHMMMAQRGYVVMCLDSRGTPAPRGRDWRKIIYKKHGLLPSDDQAAGVRAILSRWPWVDPERIGIYGWSGGGLMSLLCLFRHPDVYQTAMAGAYLSNHRFYHAAFTERYLGLPQDNPEAYRDTAALTYAGNLKGNLLLLHGTGDDNVHYQNTEALVDELIAAKKRFSMMAYPNRSHGMSEGRETAYHRHDLYMWYLDLNMPGGPRPQGVQQETRSRS